MRAYINGIPFDVTDPEENVEWNVHIYEYITGQPPTSKRVSKIPSKYNLSGVLAGKLALLKRQMLIGALESEHIKLIHPIWGSKQVTCVKYDFKSYGGSIDAYMLEIELIDAPMLAETGLVSKITKAVVDSEKLITDLGTRFYTAMQSFAELTNDLEKVKSIFRSIDGFITAPKDGVTSPLKEVVNGISDRPKLDPTRIFGALVTITSVLSPRTIEEIASSDGLKQFTGETRFVFETIVVLLTTKTPGTLPPSLSRLINDVVSNPQMISDQLFAYLWERSLDARPIEPRVTVGNKPSLVAAFERYGHLDADKELANAAGQPFRV